MRRCADRRAAGTRFQSASSLAHSKDRPAGQCTTRDRAVWGKTAAGLPPSAVRRLLDTACRHATRRPALPRPPGCGEAAWCFKPRVLECGSSPPLSKRKRACALQRPSCRAVYTRGRVRPVCCVRRAPRYSVPARHLETGSSASTRVRGGRVVFQAACFGVRRCADRRAAGTRFQSTSSLAPSKDRPAGQCTTRGRVRPSAVRRAPRYTVPALRQAPALREQAQGPARHSATIRLKSTCPSAGRAPRR